MCDDAPIEITTPCGLWAEDILLNYSRDANTCWEAHNPFEHLLHEGGKMSDAFDPFGTCIETNANTLPPHETTDSLQLIPTPTQYIEPTIDLVSIVVASRDIPRGEIVIEDMLMLELWPKQALPEETEYFTNLNDVIGQTARTDILIRSPILRRQVVEKAE